MARITLMSGVAAAALCVMRAPDGHPSGGKVTMTKAEIDELLEGGVEAATERFAFLSPSTRAKIAEAEMKGQNRTTLLAVLEKLGDAPAEKVADETGDKPAGGDEQKPSEPLQPPADLPPTEDPEASRRRAAPEEPGLAAAEARANAAEARAASLETVAAEAQGRAAALEAELEPFKNVDLNRQSAQVEALEQRLRDASASEPVERMRGLVLEYGEPFGIAVQDGEPTPELLTRFLVAADKMRVDLGRKVSDLGTDLREANQKLVNARKKNDPGALAKGRATTKSRKLGEDFEPLKGDDGDQSPLDTILAGDDALELVFSDGVNELVEFAPYDVRGTSFVRTGAGWMLSQAITLRGLNDDTRVRGAALLRDGKQVAWSSFIEPVRIPRNQDVNFDRMIAFK